VAKKDIVIDKTKAEAALYKKDYYTFFIDAFAALYPDEIFYDNWHIKYCCDLLENEAVRIKNHQPKSKDYVVNLPYRACKSLLFTCAIMLGCGRGSPRRNSWPYRHQRN
jgi:hypothetical protein